MKIYNPNISGQSIGGGWTFQRNFNKAMREYLDIEFVAKWQDCDIFFISGSTMVNPDEIEAAKKNKKKIVLRVDNIPRNSRNRNTGTSRLFRYAQLADTVIYQSKWAKDYVGYFLKKEGTIIYNGVDTTIFNDQGREDGFKSIYLYVQYNRDENKRFPEACDMFRAEWRKDNRSRLHLVGQFSPELRDTNFDFFMGETIHYFGVITEPIVMAKIMKEADILLYPSYSDALPNTVIEAVACGMEVRHRGHAGVGEAATMPDPSLERMGREYYELFKKL